MKHEYMIILNKNFFTVYTETPAARRLLESFNKKFNTYKYIYNHKLRKKVREVDRIYVGGNHNFNEFRYNINFIKDFMWLLRNHNIDKDKLSIIHGDNHKVNPLGLTLNKDYTLRDYQEVTSSDIITNDKRPTHLIGFQTGKGKTLTAVSTLCSINESIALIILPKYIEKWIDDFKEITDATDDDIVVIKGSKDLIQVMEMAASGEYVPKIMIFSNRTIFMYIKAYENVKNIDDFLYPVTPNNFMETFGIGSMVVDEVHQEFFSVYKASLYFNVNRLIAMSATLDSDDKSVIKFYEALFPKSSRIDPLTYDAYINTHAIQYHLAANKSLKSVGSMGYNHIAVEQNIMKHSKMLNNYIEMLLYYSDLSYMKRRKDGDKLLIFAASIELCSILTTVFSEKYPNLKVSRYVEDDDYENVLTSDITISTIQSSGTAFDIKGLITVINSISVKSKPANLQSFGRLRKKDGVEMHFYYFYSKDVDRQYEYHKARLELFKPRSKAIFIEEYPKPI